MRAAVCTVSSSRSSSIGLLVDGQPVILPANDNPDHKGPHLNRFTISASSSAQPSKPSAAAAHALAEIKGVLYSGPGTALLMGAILLRPSHCPRGSLFFFPSFHT
ncbi:hypothetical protein N7474_005075 [Penicillium riverlandense]|uniref:uncharacterized protein n=1 Tax=Penicillium riverlandense TaxID=1903569 RepID=UPI0025483C05|nr:uncharacterized protein N7474_005075 [Penicillium riverlandense]KAJ5819484.1 hypothetical protein N7474_005075 [Penicillium riverlandense]